MAPGACWQTHSIASIRRIGVEIELLAEERGAIKVSAVGGLGIESERAQQGDRQGFLARPPRAAGVPRTQPIRQVLY